MYQRDFQKRVRVGLVGVGSHTYRNLLPAMHHLPITVAAMCNRGEDRLNRTAQEYHCPAYLSTAEMYDKEDLDGVVISVSPEQHPDLACEALKHNLNVFIEKPPAMTAAEVERMIENRGDKVVVVGFKKIFMPAAYKAYELINSTKYGNLKSILAIYPMSIPEDGEKILADRIFTNWLGNGCHPLSLMLAAAGKVAAVTTHCNREGYGLIELEFESGVIGNLHLASGPQPLEEYHFYADTWQLAIQNTDRVVLQRGIPFDYSKTWNFVPEGDNSGAVVWEPQNCLATLENKSIFLQGIVQELNYFCECILSNSMPRLGSLEFALDIMRLYEAVLLSNGKTIQV